MPLHLLIIIADICEFFIIVSMCARYSVIARDVPSLFMTIIEVPLPDMPDIEELDMPLDMPEDVPPDIPEFDMPDVFDIPDDEPAGIVPIDLQRSVIIDE